MGLSLGHTRQVLAYGFGLEVSRAGVCRALARMAGQAEPTYAGLVEAARQSPVNGVDETGWKVGGRLQWLHVAVSAQVTVYAILPGRGYEQSVVLLGADYDGFLVHDGWAPYYRFRFAFHQSCLSHLLKHCQEMAHIASPAAVAFPLAVRYNHFGLTIQDAIKIAKAIPDEYDRRNFESKHRARSEAERQVTELITIGDATEDGRQDLEALIGAHFTMEMRSIRTPSNSKTLDQRAGDSVDRSVRECVYTFGKFPLCHNCHSQRVIEPPVSLLLRVAVIHGHIFNRRMLPDCSRKPPSFEVKGPAARHKAANSGRSDRCVPNSSELH
jgi:transposase IS66 family protein